MKKNKKVNRIQESLTVLKVIAMIVVMLVGALQSNSLRIDIDTINVVVSL